jgi:membrane protein
MPGFFKNIFKKTRQLRESLWLDELYLKRRWYIVLMRIIAIFWRGVFDNSLFSRAAALSYSSLLALAPILGFFVLLSGSFLKVDPETHIKHALVFVAPSLEQYVDDGSSIGAAAADAGDDITVDQRKEMHEAFDILIHHMISGVRENVRDISRSGRSVAGIIGATILVWLGITLLIAIENAMNDIWGVKRGRGWGRKFVLYWSVLSLGILASVALLGLSSSTTLEKFLVSQQTTAPSWLTPVLSIIGLTMVLTFFYKLFPNTRVRLAPALVGGAVAAMLLVANNVLSMLYIRSVLSIQSLYGSVGILLVMMLGLYLFWAFLLLGAQLTYAVQNAQFLADQKSWQNASERTRETITFAAFIFVSRRFSRCESPLSADEIAETMLVPTNILNESLGKLCEMGFVTAMDDGSEDGGSDRPCFIPARPLKSVSFQTFRTAYASNGVDKGTAKLRMVDPLVDMYRHSMEDAVRSVSNDGIDVLLEKTAAQVASEKKDEGGKVAKS